MSGDRVGGSEYSQSSNSRLPLPDRCHSEQELASGPGDSHTSAGASRELAGPRGLATGHILLFLHYFFLNAFRIQSRAAISSLFHLTAHIN